MTLYHSMHELIGNTPIVELTNLDLPENTHIFAKLELFNPGGSVKDRTGKYMIADAEKRGILKPNGTIIEATAGNTGLGIAFAALCYDTDNIWSSIFAHFLHNGILTILSVISSFIGMIIL